MPGEIKNFLLAFIPIFVAMDAIGVLPFFLAFTEGMKEMERKRVLRASILTGFVVSLGFLAVGKIVFAVIGITIPDFKVAGGTILLIILIRRLLFHEKNSRMDEKTVGIVPLGAPLIVGPAVLTTTLLPVDTS